MGACSVTVNKRSVMGDRVVVTGTLSPSASYANSAGDTFTAADFKLQALDSLIINPVLPAVAAGAAVPVFAEVVEPLSARGTNNLKLYQATVGSQITNATDVSAKKFRFIAIGR